MPKGSTYLTEAQTTRDARTGAVVRQVTSHPSIHHPPFYYLPPYDDSGERLYFVSHRTGLPQIFFEERRGGQLVQLTERDDLNEWSVHPSHDGRYVYFTAGAVAWRADTHSFKEERLAHFGDVPMRETGMVGAAMGTTALSRDDRYWCIPVRHNGYARMFIIDTSTGTCEPILERDTIGHPQFHPDDCEWLRYAGPYSDRIWIIRRDGSGNKLVYRRNAETKEWIVHETWMPGSREILTVNWPHGVMGIHADSGAVRWVQRFNAWHPMISRDGTRMITDTKHPDMGLVLFDPRKNTSPRQTVCYPEATSRGDHWHADHCPYDDGPTIVEAPQHTHPHPNFSPDGRKVVFTSDRTGFAQVYEVELPV